jgi:uncharacterized surface protein with fasciclin (FAS1) repeats
MKKLATLWGAALAFVSLCFVTSCQDKVDTGDMYTFLGQTITDYTKTDSTLSMFSKILSRSKVSKKSKSALDVLLSTRGNYTVFAPTNDAVKLYLDSIYNYQPYDLDTMSQDIADKITQNCIIDDGDNDAMKSADFITGAINEPTFNDRHILVSFDTINGGQLSIILNSQSRITVPDIELTNGVLHKVNKVISPSNSSLSALLSETPNMRIFSHLLEETSWADSMVKYRDEAYEDIPDEVRHRKAGDSWQHPYPSPEHRYYGYTAFVESDSVFESDWGIPELEENNGTVTNWTEVMNAIIEKCKEAYPDATSDDLKSQNNAVNQFVSYHLINSRVPFNMLVNHLTELGYYHKLPDQLTLDVWEYYLTMGKFNRMFKITQPAKTGTININRHCTYDNSFNGDYHEISCDREGVLVNATNGSYTNNALNGYYYPINHMLIYDKDVPNKVLNERMRYDAMATMPELTTNGIRHPAYRSPANVPSMFVNGFTFSDETECSMIQWGEDWVNWQGDELIFYGQVDLTFKLLPVPFDGTYEVRIGCANLGSRVMAQLYFGTDPKNLPATGLPIDFRISTTSPYIDWINDQGLDEDQCLENDKAMRNKGYMKGPKYFCCNQYGHPMNDPMRNHVGTLTGLRKVLYQGYMQHDKTYYIRVKSVLDGTGNGMDLDYVEIVPKWVYNGPEGEDIW